VLAALRAPQWLHFLALPAAGLDGAALARPAQLALRLGGAVGLAALALAYAYGLNAISDRATDLDPRKNPLAGVAACPPAIVAAMIAVGAGALVAGFALGHLGAVTGSLAAATIYSIGPRLKRLPFLGTALNAGIFVPMLFFARSDVAPSAFVLWTTTFTALLLQNQLLHERADAVEDAASGVRTTARVLGDRATWGLALALGVVGVTMAFVVAPSLVAALLSTAVLIAGSVVAGLPGARDKPKLGETKPKLGETKPKLGETKPKLGETKPMPIESTPGLGETKLRLDWARRRLLHRVVAFACGAMLYLATRPR
jgi:4-hydroxybenzoate polyprenyltransferase